MKIEALAVGFIGESHDAMAGVLVDPFLGHGLRGGFDGEGLAGIGVAPLGRLSCRLAKSDGAERRHD